MRIQGRGSLQPVSARLLSRGRRSRWIAVVVLAVITISIQMIAATASSAPVLAAPFETQGSQSPAAALARVEVPAGAQPCPNSGFGASCSNGTEANFDNGDVSQDAIQQGKSTRQIELSADKTALAAGDTVQLSVSTTISVAGKPWAIEVFDQANQALVGACPGASTCDVAFSSKAGAHTFVAYLAVPSATIPVVGIRLRSGALKVQWLGVTLAASNPSAVGPGRAVTFTATASAEVSKIGYQIELSDTTTGHLLTYCSQGTTCSTSLIEPDAGTHTIVADLIPAPGSSELQPVPEKSAPVSATWLSVVLSAGAYSLHGGTTAISVSANADLTNTPWAIFIFRSPGQLIGVPCVSATCVATVNLPAASTPSFFAIVARKDFVDTGPASPSRVLGHTQAGVAVSDIQARSAVVTPVRMTWGVDSCAAFTQDPAGSTGLLPKVTAMLGTPDFWGRYLPTTGNCPALSATEVAAAQSRHMGILPIYNDYDCSAVSGYAAGAAYAASAVQIATADQIPLGTGVAIDIEPPGDACPGAANVDVGFINGWYDVITSAGYAPIYYGNTTPGSSFGQAWCATVAQRPEIATSSFLWSFEPDLLGGFTKLTAPAFAPYNSGCGGQYDAWQYRISGGSAPDVDHDEATNQLPIWYP
jgi:Domain of unknown function (DUF1906)